jgi:CheY-like chemotaxis protein
MLKRVLNVGQCGPDHHSISTFLKRHFDVEVATVDSQEEALQAVQDESFDLVLLNRIFDATGTEGMETLRQLKLDTATSEIPVMLVSNFADAQEAAVAEGALPGFGKSALDSPDTRDRLQNLLS